MSPLRKSVGRWVLLSQPASTEKEIQWPRGERILPIQTAQREKSQVETAGGRDAAAPGFGVANFDLQIATGDGEMDDVTLSDTVGEARGHSLVWPSSLLTQARTLSGVSRIVPVNSGAECSGGMPHRSAQVGRGQVPLAT